MSRFQLRQTWSDMFPSVQLAVQLLPSQRFVLLV